jgi:hypothetical protein
MPGLVPGIHASQRCNGKDVDGWDKPGHDDADSLRAVSVSDRVLGSIIEAFWSGVVGLLVVIGVGIAVIVFVFAFEG